MWTYLAFQTVQEVLNLHPNLVKFSGSCDPDSATLILTEDNITLTFSFSLVCFASPRIIYTNGLLNYSAYVGIIITYVICLFPFQNSTSNKYHLSGLELSAALPDMTSKSLLNIPCSIVLVLWKAEQIPFCFLFCLERIVFRNTTLNYMVGSLGHSYMCQKEKTLSVTQDFSLNTFQLQVQPFGVNGDFGAGFFFLFSLLTFLSFVL